MSGVLQAWGDLPPVFADRLMAMLDQEGRPAHGLHRVNALLLDADRVCAAHWRRPLRWAILYHCAVHDPHAPAADNRRASAEVWAEHFPALHETVRNVSAAWEVDVATAIRADPLARPGGLLAWQDAFLDLRLGTLGATPDLYRAARLLDRAEATAAGMAPALWHAGRQEYLARVAACRPLFRRVHRDREDAARVNVAAERAAAGPA